LFRPSLAFPDISGAKIWSGRGIQGSHQYSWRQLWAVSDHERGRLKIILEAVSFYLNKFDLEDVSEILVDVDIPIEKLKNRLFCKSLEPRGFWRIDQEKAPELRHTVLSLIAFHDLKEKGLDAFLAQNNGEGWLIPETLRLADYGLGHDERAQVAQPVASRLGPRFCDWQLNEDVARSWDECAAHAALIRRIVPLPVADDALESTEDSPQQPQGALF
jgi:hypothetical protein